MSLSNNPRPAKDTETSVSSESMFTKTPTLKTNPGAVTMVNTPAVNTKNKWLLPLSVVAALSLSTNATQFFMHNKTPDSDLAKVGKIIEKQEQAGAVSYLLELPSGEKTVVYGAKGANALFYGEAYQADTQDLLFSNMSSKSTVVNQSAQTAQDQTGTASVTSATADTAQNGASAYLQYGQNDLTPGQAIPPKGGYTGKVPDLFPILDALSGYKEDPTISPANTIYVIYDPRCPFCHKLFADTRNIDLKAKGITIKWLPATVLKDPEKSTAQAVAAMRAKTEAEFASTLGNPDSNEAASSLADKPLQAQNITDKEKQALNDNAALFAEAHKTAFKDKDIGPSVPATFFLDKRTGEPRLIYGASIPEIRKTIFGE